MSMEKIIIGPNGKRLDISDSGAAKVEIVGTGINQLTQNVNLMVYKVKDYWSGSSNITKTFPTDMSSLLIVNDGKSNITVTIKGLTFTIMPSEIFDENFDLFKTVVITTNSEYRAWVRG